jgi:hypothetical protein
MYGDWCHCGADGRFHPNDGGNVKTWKIRKFGTLLLNQGKI